MIRKILSLLVLGALFVACKSEADQTLTPEKEVTNEATELVAEEIEFTENEIADVDLVNQYETIKNLILDSDEEGLRPYLHTEDRDPKIIIDMILADDIMMNAFYDSKYSDIEEYKDDEGNTVMESNFYASYFMEGDTYESAVMIYFEIEEGKLYITGYFAAG